MSEIAAAAVRCADQLDVTSYTQTNPFTYTKYDDSLTDFTGPLSGATLTVRLSHPLRPPPPPPPPPPNFFSHVRRSAGDDKTPGRFSGFPLACDRESLSLL